MSYDTSAANDKLTGTFGASFTYPFTIVAWTKKSASEWADTSDDKLVMINEDTADINSGHALINRGVADNVAAATYRESDGGRFIAEESFTDGTYDDTWVVVVGIFAASNDRKVYIENSTNEGLNTSNITTNNVIEIAVGGTTQSGFQQWNGLVAEVAVFDKELSGAEINALQTTTDAEPGNSSGPPPNTVAPANCIGYWSLSTDQATHADESGNGGPTLTVESSAAFDSDHPTIVTGGIAPINHLRDLLAQG